jgi:hypothetical protein
MVALIQFRGVASSPAGITAKETVMRDVSKLKSIGSLFCKPYQSEAKFYIDEAHSSGTRHLVVFTKTVAPIFLLAFPTNGPMKKCAI